MKISVGCQLRSSEAWYPCGAKWEAKATVSYGIPGNGKGGGGSTGHGVFGVLNIRTARIRSNTHSLSSAVLLLFRFCAILRDIPVTAS